MPVPVKPRVLISLLVIIAAILFPALRTTTPVAAQSATVKIIYAGRLIDGVSNAVRTNVSIIIEKDRVREVRNGRATIDGAEVIDLGDATVMPGFIDCHTHMTMELGRGSSNVFLGMGRRDAEIALASIPYLRRTLMAGFTAVRDVGAANFLDVSLRDAVSAGTITGPRLFVAGRALSITGGHGDFGGIREDLIPEPGYKEGIINTPEDGVRAVRYLAKYGVDHIKFTATGGVLSIADSGSGQQFTLAEMKAIIDTAHLLDRKVAAHAHGAAGMKDAIRAGVDSIEHGSYLDEEAIALFKKHGTYLVPTIIAGKTVENAAKIPGFFPPPIEEKARTIGPLIQNAFARAYKGGVKIAFGTDAGVYPHGQNAKEFEYMVEAGMPALAAILSATRGSADLMGQSANLGSIQTGRYADIIAVKGDPTADIKLLQNMSFVMKGGQVYKKDGKPMGQ